MGLFTPKITPYALEHVQYGLKQINECAKLINTTVKPDVFFGRLNFLLDLLLDLQSYEKYHVFRGSTPSQDYQRIITNLEKTVNDFLDRATDKELNKISSLKTEKARKNRAEKFVISILTAFEMSHTFWVGNGASPHYTGPLYCDSNIDYFRSIVAPVQQITD